MEEVAEYNTGVTLIEEAGFNPGIKRYILVVIGLLFLITIAGIPLMLVWFLGLGQYISRRYYESLECRLTTRHLEYKKGVFFRVEKTIPLENIQDLTFVTNPILNLFDLKILKIETAGSSGAQGADMKLIGITGAADFKGNVLKQREILKMGEKNVNPPSSEKDEMLIVLKEIRDLLKSQNN